MKRIAALFLIVCMAVALFAGCGTQKTTPINIGALKGPTGMGMVTLMGEEFSGKYNITIESAPDVVTGKLINGELDIAAVPVNLASVLYNKTKDESGNSNIMMIAVNTLGVLYVLEDGDTVNSLTDLAGKTLYATGQGSTPEYMLSYLLEKSGLTDSVSVEIQGRAQRTCNVDGFGRSQAWHVAGTQCDGHHGEEREPARGARSHRGMEESRGRGAGAGLHRGAKGLL